MTSSGRAAYGSLAERLSSSSSADDPVVISDASGIAEALRDCASRRARGERFYVRLALARESTIRTDAVVPTILSSFASLDERRVALEEAFAGTLQVNGRRLSEISAYTPEALRLLQAALHLADGLVVSSQAERRRVAEVVFDDPPAIVAALEDPLVPVAPRDLRETYRDAVVLWAPRVDAAAISAFEIALCELHAPLLVVSDAGRPASSSAQWIPTGRASEALARANLILDPSPFGCDAIRRLATWGVPLVADAESGAYEHLDGVRVFDRRRLPSIHQAVAGALAAHAPRVAARSRTITESVPEALPSDGPRVSIVLPTYDRPSMLRDALESIRRQTYRNVETVVVVDGGPRLDELAAEYPEAVFLHRDENKLFASINAAFAATTGEYVGFLNDDDVFFPNHVAALVAALERSGGSVAHGDVLTAYLRGSDEDGWRLYGFESNMSRSTDVGSLLVSNQIGMISCMFRRSCIADGVLMEGSIPIYRDYALWLRLAREHDFLHVERITTCYTIRNQGAQQQSTHGHGLALGAYRAIYERHPVPGRPLLERRREQILSTIERGGMQLGTTPAGTLEPAAWPLWRD